ncbi:hypothetical protein OK016_20995 [Vibrio chagasii]|nr:hypothetical protein [Vibrio chagasii]
MDGELRRWLGVSQRGVIEDKLNVAAELEADIALNIENYQCEGRPLSRIQWKMKRFQHYINSEEMDF